MVRRRGDDDRVEPVAPADAPERDGEGAPVGRRIVLGLLGAGVLGIVAGQRVENGMSNALAKIEQRDPSGLFGLAPLGDTFRFYSVTGPVKTETAADYTLRVGGLVSKAATYTMADLEKLPQASLVQDFQCVTGWHVPQVHWAGVRLSTLIDLAGPTSGAHGVRFTSFDGTYTESLTLTEARRPDVIVATQMLGAPVTHDHGGPVRMYVGSNYGYKSTKWLSGIELVDKEMPGYWETRGYDIDGTIQR